MATNLALDPKLIERAVKLSGEKTKKAAVTRALEEFIARRNQKRLVDLMGKLEWDENLRLQSRAFAQLSQFIDTSVHSAMCCACALIHVSRQIFRLIMQPHALATRCFRAQVKVLGVGDRVST